jgi:hypothetical protein
MPNNTQKKLAMDSVQLSEAKLRELAENPNNMVYHYQDQPDSAATPPVTSAQESRKMVQEIRYRCKALHEEYPEWTKQQIQNKLCRENPVWRNLSQTQNRLWQKISDFDAPPHEIKHVHHILTVMEREEKKEITHEEAKSLVTFYLQQNVGKKTPKRNPDKNKK